MRFNIKKLFSDNVKCKTSVIIHSSRSKTVDGWNNATARDHKSDIEFIEKLDGAGKLGKSSQEVIEDNLQRIKRLPIRVDHLLLPYYKF